MASSEPIRTGNDDDDFASGLYKPLRRYLGDEQFSLLTDAIADAIRNGTGKTPEEIVNDAVQAMDDRMDEIACAYNPDTKLWQWWNPRTGQWDGPC